MPWTKITSGHYQRPIGENEAFIKFIGDSGHVHHRDNWSIAATVSFKPRSSLFDQDSSELLRRAWMILRFYHPSIAATATEQMVDYHCVSDAGQLDHWADETFITHVDKSSTPQQIISKLQPSRYATVHYLPHSFQVILHLSHWRTDGVGALQLLDAFLKAVISALHQDVTTLAWGEEWQRLTLSVEEILDLPMTASSEILDASSKFIATLANTKCALGTPYRGDNQTVPGGTQSVRIRLSALTTQTLIDACNRLGISLTSAVHAAIAATNFLIAPVERVEKGKEQHHTSTLRVNVREYLPAPYNTSDYAAGLYTGGYMVKVSDPQNWLENARLYEQKYRQGATCEFLQSRRQYALTVKSLLQNRLPENQQPPSSGLDISSVGDAGVHVQASYGSGDAGLDVCSVSLGVEVLARNMYCFMWTFCNQLEFNLVYNEAFYDRQFLENVLDTLQSVLKENCIVIFP